MHITISSASQFRAAFQAAGRTSQFSYEALNMLFDYFKELDGSAELDVVAICCEYTEDQVSNIIDTYPSIDANGLSAPEAIGAVLAYLNKHTTVVGCPNQFSVVYASF